MKRDLDRLSRESWDLVVVGGGIHGVCAVREAALRGLRACLLERGDFGSATSSQSLRIVHGGIRYLQHLDFVRMRQSIVERRRLLAIAPHLVEPLPCVMPTHGIGVRGRAAMAAALAVHDVVGLDRNVGLAPRSRLPRGRILSRGELLALFPGLPAEGVTGGALWHDAQAWSTERLLVAFLASGVAAGAEAANHAEVERLILHERRVVGVLARDRIDGRTFEVRGRAVLNAAGPWIDEVLSRAPGLAPRVRFHPSKAFNLVVRPIVRDHAIGIPCGAAFRDADGVVGGQARVIFLVPWRGRTLIGTRHLPFRGEPDACAIDGEEIERLLAEVNAGFPPARLRASDILAVHAGVLPEKEGADAGDVQLEKHPILVDHAREDGIEGLVTAAGVKWTTARRVAADAVDLAVSKLGSGRSREAAQDVPVAGGEIVDFERFVDETRGMLPAGVPAESVEPLCRAHGTDARSLLDRVREQPELGRPIHDGSPILAVQVLHAITAEMALRLDDVVLRRTELWLDSADPLTAIERCADVAAAALGWDTQRSREEVRRTMRSLGRAASAAHPSVRG